jgi:hypothetical protein
MRDQAWQRSRLERIATQQGQRKEQTKNECAAEHAANDLRGRVAAQSKSRPAHQGNERRGPQAARTEQRGDEHGHTGSGSRVHTDLLAKGNEQNNRRLGRACHCQANECSRRLIRS